MWRRRVRVRVRGVGSGAGAGPGQPAIDLGDRWVVPGYIDLHVHGGGGAQCNTTDAEEILAMARFHASHGTTALLATTVAGRVSDLEAAVATIAAVVDRREDGAAAVLGSHLEGPFLSRERPGAMDPALFLDPDPRAVDRLLSASEGTVQMVTVAPELSGALDLVRRLSDDGVVVSLGHSDASYEQTEAAVRAGARAATHLFNAMRPLHHREPGVLGAVLDLDGVSCELICDGIHVDPAALRIAYRAKGTAGVRLVTDAMQAAGMPDGEYQLGSATVMVRAGRAENRGGRLDRRHHADHGCRRPQRGPLPGDSRVRRFGDGVGKSGSVAGSGRSQGSDRGRDGRRPGCARRASGRAGDDACRPVAFRTA